MQPFINSTIEDLFCKMQRSSHCLYPLLPPDRERSYSLRDTGHSFQLPTCHYNLHKKSFVISCLFEFLTKYFLLFLYFLHYLSVCNVIPSGLFSRMFDIYVCYMLNKITYLLTY